MRTDADRVQDILDAIARIEEKTATGKGDFLVDQMLQVWVVHHLEIVGEAAKGLSEKFRRSRPKVPWNEISRMRDRLVHGYWNVDLETVWQVVQRDLPSLKAALKSVR